MEIILEVYQGDLAAVRLGLAAHGVATGTGVSQAFGGWIYTDCNLAINASGCLTFILRTNGDNAFKFGGQDLSRFDQSVNEDGQRKMNVLSALITGMTDNAKEQLAKRFGLNIEAVGIVGYLIAGGMSFNDAILIINQPVVKEYFKVLKNSKSTLKFAKDQGNPKKVIANLIDTIEAVYKDKEGEDPAEDFNAQNREQ